MSQWFAATCVSGYQWSSAIPNTNVLGGTGNSAATVDACQSACSSTANCIGIDWVPGNAAGQQCFILVSTSAGHRNNGTAAGVTHYDYTYVNCSSKRRNLVQNSVVNPSLHWIICSFTCRTLHMPGDYTLKTQLKPLLCLNFPRIFSSLARASAVNLINAETLKIGRVYLLSYNHSTQGYGLSNV